MVVLKPGKPPTMVLWARTSKRYSRDKKKEEEDDTARLSSLSHHFHDIWRDICLAADFRFNTREPWRMPSTKSANVWCCSSKSKLSQMTLPLLTLKLRSSLMSLHQTISRIGILFPPSLCSDYRPGQSLRRSEFATTETHSCGCSRLNLARLPIAGHTVTTSIPMYGLFRTELRCAKR